METANPVISCLMLAGSDPQKAARAILCYQQQTWEQKELIVIDNGEADLGPLLEDIAPDELRYIRKNDGKSRAYLKNMGLDHAGGDYVIHWEEQDWHHPDRIREQWSTISAGGNEYSLLGNTLLHLDLPELVHHPIVDSLSYGYPESIMHRNRTGFRYPAVKKKPDLAFLKRWGDSARKKLGEDHAHLLIRNPDAGSPASKKQFLSRFSGVTGDVLQSVWITLRGKNMLMHRRFRLSEKQRESFKMYLRESQKLGVIASIGDQP